MFDLKRITPLALTLLVAFSRPVAAQPGTVNAAAAQALFDDAMALMDHGKAAEACPKLEKAQRFDPGMATQFRLAECYEKAGRSASAWALFGEVADAAKAAHRPEREVVARQRATALEPLLLKLTVKVPGPVAAIAGLEIQRDGREVDKAHWGEAVPVDPGEHTVVATAPGKQRWESKGSARPSLLRVEVTVPMLLDATETSANAATSASPEAPSTRRSLVPAFVVGGVSVVALGVGVALRAASSGALSNAEASSAELRAGGLSCVPGSTNYVSAPCADLAAQTQKVDTLRNGGLVSILVGSAALGGALVYALWPSKTPASATSRVHAVPLLSRSEGGLLVSGSF